MLSQTPIKRRKISEEVADRIERMIRDDSLKVGDPLPSEREIMAALGVGRSAVREAFFALNKRGLVEIRNGEKARVAAPDLALVIGEMSGAARRMLALPDGVRNFQDARRLFETGVAARAAERADAADIEGLAAVLEANRRAIGMQSQFHETDFLFHRQIAFVAHNPVFLAVTEALVMWLLEQRHRTTQDPEHADVAYRAHEDIFKAIAARRPKEAAGAMDRHLMVVEKLYWAKDSEQP
jgi:GntR family transcriptional repressor for pyruvate dehydrogenase complex